MPLRKFVANVWFFFTEVDFPEIMIVAAIGYIAALVLAMGPQHRFF